MEYQQFVLGELMANCYLLWSGNEAGIIDPGGAVTEIIQFLDERQLRLQWILNTHGHVDHIVGNGELRQRYHAPILIHSADRQMLTSPLANLSAFIGAQIVSPEADRTVSAGEQLNLNNESLTVIETPGHTQGGISLYTKGLLFSGDTLFQESIGRTDFPGGNYQQLLTSIKEHLFILSPETLVLPGHGESTTIAHEIKCNPFVNGSHEILY